MMNISVKKIEELKECITEYKNFISLYEQAIEMSEEKEYQYSNPYTSVISSLKKEVKEVGEVIINLVEDCYKNYKELNRLFRECTAVNLSRGLDEYYEAVETIYTKDCEVCGACNDMVCIDNEMYLSMKHIPLNFMHDFILEYGMFEIGKNNNDIWIL